MATTVTLPEVHFEAVWSCLVRFALPHPVTADSTEATSAITWDPDLTPDHAAIVQDAIAAARMGISYDLYVAAKTELPTQRTYLGLANPSAAQRLAWEKSTIRLMRVLFKFD